MSIVQLPEPFIQYPLHEQLSGGAATSLRAVAASIGSAIEAKRQMRKKVDLIGVTSFFLSKEW